LSVRAKPAPYFAETRVQACPVKCHTPPSALPLEASDGG
jgi:hypothetical protein